MEGVKQAFAYFLAATPDGYHILEDMIGEEDSIVTRLTGYGTQTGELFGIPPSGKEIRATSIAIYRVANGKIVEHWGEADNLGVMQQLGVVPTPEAPAGAERSASRLEQKKRNRPIFSELPRETVRKWFEQRYKCRFSRYTEGKMGRKYLFGGLKARLHAPALFQAGSLGSSWLLRHRVY